MFDISESRLLLSAGDAPRLLAPAKEDSEINNSGNPAFISNCSCRLLTVQEKACANCRLQTRIDYLRKANKLTAASWNKLLIALKIPSETGHLSSRQARRLHHLLDHLAAHSELMTKTNLNEADWRNWFAEHLPLALRPCLEIVKAGKSSPFVKKQKTIKQEKPKISGKKQRQKISPELYSRVAARQGSYCFWCGIPVTREQQIPTANRLRRTNSTIVYLSREGCLREDAIGTIDHLVRVTDGGNNEPENLVISCLDCNLERERVTARYGRPFARRSFKRFVCRSCGGRFFHPRWGCCSVCGGVNENFAGKLTTFFYGLVSLIGSLISKRG